MFIVFEGSDIVICYFYVVIVYLRQNYKVVQQDIGYDEWGKYTL